MAINNIRQEVLGDLDRLHIGYQIKLYSAANEDWQPYFRRLSVDSHQNNALFLARDRLFDGQKSSLTLSGLALGKKHQVRQISLVSERKNLTAIINRPSVQLGRALPNIKGSANARWRCEVALKPEKKKQNFDLIISLDNGQEITFQKIEFRQVNLGQHAKVIDLNLNHKLAERVNSIQTSREIMASDAAVGRHYLFAIGNARSGTTALGRLLNYSCDICLGIERYLQKENVSATSFTKASFFDCQSENYLVRPHFYEKIRDKFDRARYVGDKRPGFVRSWRNTWLNLPKAKIIYIFRNVHDVACSYNVRANDAADSWSSQRDFAHAVRDWNKGMREVKNLMDFYEAYLVKYEDFFVNPDLMTHLFNYLDIDPTKPDVSKGIYKCYQAALNLQDKSRVLSSAQLEYVNSNADFAAYNELLALYEKQF